MHVHDPEPDLDNANVGMLAGFFLYDHTCGVRNRAPFFYVTGNVEEKRKGCKRDYQML